MALEPDFILWLYCLAYDSLPNKLLDNVVALCYDPGRNTERREQWQNVIATTTHHELWHEVSWVSGANAKHGGMLR
jgi:hypothetical protein